VKNTNKVLATKKTILKTKEAKVALSFEKIKGVTKYKIYALCDSYVGCDQV
jgi:hypothetical protein